METNFIDLESKWMNAWKVKDEVTCSDLMSDDFTLTSSLSSGNIIHKEEWIEKAMHHYHCEEFTIKKFDVRLYNETAVLNILFNQIATANGKDWSGDFLLTDVWVFKNKRWQVVSRHASWLK